MSRATPRKSRHVRQPSNRIPAISDYESDGAIMHASYGPPPTRPDRNMNLDVLQRYLPSIQEILSIAAFVVVYTFNSKTAQWEKAGIEGTMFVCAQEPLPDDTSSRFRACVFVFNRRGLDNLIVDLARVSHVEIIDELIAFKVEGDWDESEKVVGVWIHKDSEDTRTKNGAAIEESWKVARAAGGSTLKTGGPEAGPAMQAIGRPLTLDELFAKQDNAGDESEI